jgi:hypothetical protein
MEQAMVTTNSTEAENTIAEKKETNNDEPSNL